MQRKSLVHAISGVLTAAFLSLVPASSQAGGNIPAVGTPWAGMGGNIPAVGTPWAGMGGNIPAVGTPWAGMGGNIPAVGTPWAGMGGNIPAVGMPWGAMGGNIPAVGTPWAGMGGGMPTVGLPFDAYGRPFWGTLGGSMPTVGVPGWGMPTMPGGGMVVWIPAVVGGPSGAPVAAPTGGTGAPQPVLCALDPSNPAAGVPAGQKVVVIADTEMACHAINGAVENPTPAGGGT